MRCSYIAVQGASKNVALQQLGLVEGELADPNIWDTLRICEMSGGWLILLTSTIEWASEKRTRLLSRGGALAVGTCMTTVAMGVEAYAYQSGMLKWRLNYDSDRNNSLEISGDRPAELDAIHAALAKQQAEEEEGGVDYIFDVPLALGAALHGYRPDEDGPDPQPVFRLLKPSGASERRGLFATLGGIFGKR